MPVRAGRVLAEIDPAHGAYVTPGDELGQHRLRERVTRAEFIAYYEQIRRTIEEIRSAWVTEKKRRGRVNEQDTANLTAHLWQLRVLLVDVYPYFDAGIDQRKGLPYVGYVRWPLAPAIFSETLIGELALALREELLDAQAFVECRICHRQEPTKDRRERKLCGRAECALAWKKRTRQPEDPVVVAERQRRFRARRARGGRNDGKTRTR
jgi:hypothetical protein